MFYVNGIEAVASRKAVDSTFQSEDHRRVRATKV